MKWRTQLPAYSPLPLRTVLAGAASLVARQDEIHANVTDWLCQEFGCDEVLLTNSGTAALTLAIRHSLAQHPAAAIALPAYSCYSLATAADGVDAPVLFYDLDPATLAPDLSSLKQALDRGARTVVLVHLFGIPIDAAPIRNVSRAAGVCLIEDVAQGVGARWQGRPLGLAGDLTILSFGRGKGVTAGRGGAILARGRNGIPRPLAPRLGVEELLQLAAQWAFGRPSLFSIPSSIPFLRLGETVYHRPTPVSAMSKVALRALADTLALAEAETRIRRSTAARLLSCHGPGLTPVLPPADAEPGYLRLPFVATPEARAVATTSRSRKLGIMPGYPKALCDLPGFAERAVNRQNSFEGARLLAERLVTVPVHSRLSEREREELARWVASRDEGEATALS